MDPGPVYSEMLAALKEAAEEYRHSDFSGATAHAIDAAIAKAEQFERWLDQQHVITTNHLNKLNEDTDADTKDWREDQEGTYR